MIEQIDPGENPLLKRGFFAPLKEPVFPHRPRDYADLFSPDRPR